MKRNEEVEFAGISEGWMTEKMFTGKPSGRIKLDKR